MQRKWTTIPHTLVLQKWWSFSNLLLTDQQQKPPMRTSCCWKTYPYDRYQSRKRNTRVFLSENLTTKLHEDSWSCSSVVHPINSSIHAINEWKATLNRLFIDSKVRLKLYLKGTMTSEISSDPFLEKYDPPSTYSAYRMSPIKISSNVASLYPISVSYWRVTSKYLATGSGVKAALRISGIASYKHK